MAIKVQGQTVVGDDRKGSFQVTNPGQFTTAQRDALTPVTGDTIFNIDESALQIWDGTEWGSAGGADSGLDPAINSVTLTENEVGEPRFTNQTFTSTAEMFQEGVPVSTKSIKGKVTAQFATFPATKPITSESVSTSVTNDGNTTINGNTDMNSNYQGWGAVSFNAVDPTTENIRAFMYSPEGSGNSNDDMYENAAGDLLQYSTYKLNVNGSQEHLRVTSLQENRAGTHLNLWSKSDTVKGSFALTGSQGIFEGNPRRSSEAFYSTDAYNYKLTGGTSNMQIVRTNKSDGSSAGTMYWASMNSSGGGEFAFETLSDRIFVIARASNSNNLWYKELTDAYSASLDASWATGSSSIGPDGSIQNFKRNEMGNSIVHKNKVFLTSNPGQIYKFTPGNTSPQSVARPATPNGYRSGYVTLWEDPFGLLVLRMQCFVGDSSDAAYFYYSSNNEGATWVADYYPSETSGKQAEYYVPDTYLYGRRQQSYENYSGSARQKKVYTIRTQTVTVTDGEDLALLNVGDYVKAPGVSDQFEYAKIQTITSNGDGTTDIVVNGFRDFAVDDTIEATASTGSASSTRFLVIDASGTVTTTQVADPGFTEIGPSTTVPITFPSTFPTGKSPDEELPSGTTIQTYVKAENTSGSSEAISNVLLPDTNEIIQQFGLSAFSIDTTTSNQINWYNDSQEDISNTPNNSADVLWRSLYPWQNKTITKSQQGFFCDLQKNNINHYITFTFSGVDLNDKILEIYVYNTKGSAQYNYYSRVDSLVGCSVYNNEELNFQTIGSATKVHRLVIEDNDECTVRVGLRSNDTNGQSGEYTSICAYRLTDILGNEITTVYP